MVRFLLLLILLLSPIRNSDAQYSNYCYCTTSWRQGTVYGSVCTANADCWACAPGAYNTTWQQAFCPNYQAPVVTCQTETQTQTLSCPVNYTGQITQTKTKTCTTSGQGIWGDWVTTSNTCVQNPPTCQVSSQTQTLSCETGYTGSIIQTRSSTCPNPYGNPVWSAWVTTSNTCVKSITNPTNVASPVSPVSPLNPASPTSTSALTTQSSTVTAPTTSSVQSSQTTTDGLSAPTAVSSVPSSTAQTDAKATSPAPATASQTTSNTPTSTPPEPPKGMNQKSVVGRVLSLEQKVGGIVQKMNPFPEVSINQEIPLEMRQNNKFLMDILSSGSIIESIGINQITKDTVEYEQ